MKINSHGDKLTRAQRVAAIDIGTSSEILAVADVAADGQFRLLANRCRVDRLGRGVDKTHLLDPKTMAQTLETMNEYGALIRELGCERVKAVGTQALREATNGADFLVQAARALGTVVEVIDGKREAELAFKACMRSFPDLRRGPVTVCDVGGGSTELILGRDGEVTRLASIPIGSVRLAERFLHTDPPTPSEQRALQQAVDEALRSAPVETGAPMVGTAGTVTTLCAVSLGLEPYDPERVQGVRLSHAEVDRLLALFMGLTTDERTRLLGMEPKRADVIPAGAAIVAGAMRAAGARDLIVSDRGVWYGLLALLAEDQ